jgi:HlyD family secretion protein
MTLADLSQLQVQAQVNESDMAGVRPGIPITFTVSTYPGNAFSGYVLSVQPIGSQSQNVVTYTATCVVDVEKTDVALLPGMTASVTLVSDSRSNVLLVPSGAIQFAQSQGAPPGSVLVLVNGTPVPRPIQPGLTDGRQTEVQSGLDPGDLVVTARSGG